MKPSLKRLFQPKSIVLFGGDWAENVAQQISLSKYPGKVWPVHPKRNRIGPYKTFKSIDQLPDVPDAAFIGVNRFLAVKLIEKLSKLGTGGVSCFASGFSEVGNEGASLQNELVEVAGDMPVLGPNCYGFLNYLDNVIMWPDQHGGSLVTVSYTHLTLPTKRIV